MLCSGCTLLKWNKTKKLNVQKCSPNPILTNIMLLSFLMTYRDHRITQFCFPLQPMEQEDVVCVSKDVVQDKNAVNLKLKASSTCVSSENTPFCLPYASAYV